MYCTTCGTQLPADAAACPNCNARVIVPRPLPPAAPIDNYLVPSILVTLCCCVPIGVVAMVFAAQVNSKLAAGDLAGARQSAKNAKLWCWIGLGAGIVATVAWVLLYGMAALGHH